MAHALATMAHALATMTHALATMAPALAEWPMPNLQAKWPMLS